MVLASPDKLLHVFECAPGGCGRRKRRSHPVTLLGTTPFHARPSEVLRVPGLSCEERIRRIQALVDEALGPPPTPVPLEREENGWPKLRAARGADTGTIFWSPPDPGPYDPRD
jgi:hypothetical protein